MSGHSQGDGGVLRALLAEWQNVAQLAAVDTASGVSSHAPAAVAKELVRARASETQLKASVLKLC